MIQLINILSSKWKAKLFSSKSLKFGVKLQFNEQNITIVYSEPWTASL